MDANSKWPVSHSGSVLNWEEALGRRARWGTIVQVLDIARRMRRSLHGTIALHRPAKGLYRPSNPRA